MKTTEIDHICLKVPRNRVDDVLRFYQSFLGLKPFKLEKFRRGERNSFFLKLRSGQMLEFNPVTDFEKPEEDVIRVFLLIDGNTEEVLKEAEKQGFEVSGRGNPCGLEGQTPAVYVEDPFGYRIGLKERK